MDPQHKQTRAFLQLLGPCLVLAGLIFSAVGLVSFFSSFGSFSFEGPRYFWCLFVGFPLLGLGAAVCKFAFLGKVSRYLADEMAPVAKDAANYLAEGTSEAVRDVAAAIAEGARAGAAANEARIVRCHKCNAENEAPASFCKACGAPLTKSKPCSRCGKLNDLDARFCDNCGSGMA